MRGKSGTVVCIVSSFLNSHACRQLHKMLLCLRVCALLREQLKSPTTERVGEGWRCKSQSSPDGENHLLGAGLCFYVALVHVKEIWLINAALCLWTSFGLIDSGSHFQKMDQEFAMKPHQMQLVCGNKNSVLVLLSQTFICLLLVLDLSLQKTYCQILKYTLNGVTKLFFCTEVSCLLILLLSHIICLSQEVQYMVVWCPYTSIYGKHMFTIDLLFLIY